MKTNTINSKGWPHSSSRSELNIKLSALEKMSSAQLKLQWQLLYQTLPPPSIHRALLIQAICFKIQEGLFGGHSTVIITKLKKLVRHLEGDNNAVFDPGINLKSGARLIREWHGQIYSVTVLEKGFDYNGQIYSSLSMVAKEITGTRWSGPRFFGLHSTTKYQSQIKESGNE